MSTHLKGFKPKDPVNIIQKEEVKMNVNVNEMDRTTDVWLTQSEAGSELRHDAERYLLRLQAKEL